MPQDTISDTEFLKKLSAHPTLKQQFHSLLLSIENESGTLSQADTAELHIIEQMRQMGNASLAAWANNQHEQQSSALMDRQSVRKDGKKN